MTAQPSIAAARHSPPQPAASPGGAAPDATTASDPIPAARSSPPLRILLFTAVPRDLRGGVSAIFTRLASALRARGHTVIETWGAEPGRPPAADELPLVEIRSRWGLPTLQSLAGSARFVGRVVRLLQRERPQIVNIHFIHARMAQVLLWLRPLFGYRLVLSAHGSDLFDPPDGNDTWLPRVLPRADAIVAVTEALAERIRAFPGVDPACVHIIPGGIDAEFWRTATVIGDASEPQSSPRPPRVITVGQLRRVKGHDILLDAWPAVRAAIPGAELVIVGDGDRRTELEDQARRLGDSGSITFTGQLPPEQVRPLLHGASLFALPSRSEALPLALLEAMACGLPVVATSVGGVPELLAGSAGAVVPPEDPQALASGIITLLRDPTRAQQMAAAARHRAVSYDNASTAAAYERLLGELAGATPGRRAARKSVN